MTCSGTMEKKLMNRIKLKIIFEARDDILAKIPPLLLIFNALLSYLLTYKVTTKMQEMTGQGEEKFTI